MTVICQKRSVFVLGSSASSGILLFAAVLLFVCLNIADKLIVGRFFYSGVNPLWSWYFVARMGVLAFVSGLALLAVVNWEDAKIPTEEKPELLSKHLYVGFLAVSAAFILLMAASPATLSLLVRSEGPVEKLESALLLFSSAMFVALLFKFRALPRSLGTLFPLGTILFAVAFFLMGMEEESWFQMIVHYPTPDWIGKNEQGEANLHNFASDRFNIAYYTSAFVFLVLIPFVNDRTRIFKNFPGIVFFLAGRSIIFFGAIVSCMYYTHWASPSAQASFFMTLFILLYYQIQIWKGRMKPVVDNYWLPSLIVVCLLSQIFVHIQGAVVVSWDALEWFHRTSPQVYRTKRLEFGWDIAEYREFFIPLAYALYSLEMFRKAKKLTENNPEASKV